MTTSDTRFSDLPGTLAVRLAQVEVGALRSFGERLRASGARLLALWAADERERTGAFRLSLAFEDDRGLAVVQARLAQSAPEYPDLSDLFPAAARMQRAAFDLTGVRAIGADPRPWLRHAAWPADWFPLRRGGPAPAPCEPRPEVYDFVAVAGDGVHEIAVGPVHAGIIEPGHFRFSVVGEKVLRLEERLGYTHKGIEKRFESLSLQEGARLAARVCGDSAAAYAWAYCMALESLCDVAPPPRALWLRALLVERERIANHLGDLGALANDAGFAFGLAQFSRLKEQLLRVNRDAFGARYPFDFIVPGGVACDLDEPQRRALWSQCAPLEDEVRRLRAIYDDHGGLQDRFTGCGRISPELAVRLGLVGLAARASGQRHDLRCDHPYPPYQALAANLVWRRDGDVAARVAVRFDELFESLRLCRAILEHLPAGPVRAALAPAATDRPGFGLVESWRGPVLVALEAGSEGRVRRCHPHDPSWQNWPALEYAVIGNIVPDFPLINKSFNLAYSGHDL
jgi:Ni,Fe-hydrogenase III large subunit/Ni,Fe-hydrogenase III component G